MSESAYLLEVSHLTRFYRQRSAPGGVFRAVDDVSFSIAPGETLGLVGESGSGKSTIGRAVLMLPPPSAGSVRFAGEELVGMPPARLRSVRRGIQVVLQNPYSAFNPRMTVGAFVAEPLEIHRVSSGRAKRRELVRDLLQQVGLPPEAASRYPHQFSGGQRQRIAIARAIALKPRLIIADEPTAALDVSIQAQIINLLLDLQEQLGLSYLFISHDLRMVRHISHHIAVLQAGHIVELATPEALFHAPSHPYTRRLMAAIPLAPLTRFSGNGRATIKKESAWPHSDVPVAS